MYVVNRMETYNLSAINKEKENSTTKQVLYNNKYNVSVLNKFTTSGNKRKHKTPKTKWAKFTYAGNENSSQNISTTLP